MDILPKKGPIMQAPKIIIRAIAIIEILIGLIIIAIALSTSYSRPFSVYVFVFITSSISVLIGIGLFQYKNWARRILIFFAGYVIVTKFLLVSQLVVFTGNVVNFLSAGQKDGLSLLYHCCVLIIFNLVPVKESLT